jgi:hypothetical protein
VTVTGVVTKIEWTNPHCHFYVDVVDERGTGVNWKFEGYGRITNRVTGRKPDVSRACDPIMTRSSAENPTAWMAMVTTTRPPAMRTCVSIRYAPDEVRSRCCLAESASFATASTSTRAISCLAIVVGDAVNGHGTRSQFGPPDNGSRM